MIQKQLKSEDSMFKCKECGTEYQTKPDYCDCGNDTFEEILPQKSQEIDDEISPITDKSDMWIEENGHGYPINEKSYNEIKKETEVQTVKNNVQKLQPSAIITFAVCLLLSLLIILFAFNPKKSEEQEIKTKTEVINSQNIPAIEKIWNNSTEGLSAYQNNGKKEILTEQQTQTKKEEMKEDNSKKKVEVKQQSTPIKQTQALVTNKPVKETQTVKKQINKVQTQPNTATNKTVSNTSTSPALKINPQELANYKIKLRNYIASKIAFTSVVGDGECTFSFKISQNGTLTNKAPLKLSENDSLNEAVYNALKQVYSYNTPPTGYKNETLKLTVKMYNNSFEVYLN